MSDVQYGPALRTFVVNCWIARNVDGTAASASIRTRGVMGNPSDGYHGKTLSIIVRNFWAKSYSTNGKTSRIVLTQEIACGSVCEGTGARRRSARLLRRDSAGESHD